MPTLLTSTVHQPLGILPTASSNASPTSIITLSFQGVDFCLEPSDNNGEVSYKISPSNDNAVLVSLKSFTGTLLVSRQSSDGKLSVCPSTATANSTVPTTTAPRNNNDDAASNNSRPSSKKTVATTVEEVPDSPDIAAATADSTKGAKKVSPGQQKLPFSKATKGKKPVKRPSKQQQQKLPTKQTAAKNDTRKRSQPSMEDEEQQDNADAVAKTPKMSSTTKRTRLTDISNYNSSSSGSVGDVLGEKDATNGSLPVDDDDMMQCQQPTQDDLGHLSMPDLSQTVDSSSINDSSAVMAMESDAGCEECDDTTNNFAAHKNTSVQEILDRANSSADSVASTKKHDDDEEEEVATFMEDDDDKEDQVAAAKNSATGQGNYTTTTSDLHHFVNNTMTTEATNSKGHGPPCARWGATMCKIHDDQILVYGGQSYDLEGNACIMEDVHIYNPKLATWEKPINSRGEKRQWHSSVYIPSRKQIIAFGGETIDPVSAAAKNKEKVVISDTLRVLDTDIMLWYPPAATGDVPTGRSGHSSVFFPETNEMVLFGGVRGSKWLNAVSILDISSWVWTTPKVEGMPPKPRSFHSATAVGNKMVIFGGNNKTSCFNTVHVLESIGRASGDESPGKGKVCEWKWSHPSVKGKAPFPRTGHSATLLEDGKTICIYGGWDPNEEDEMSGEENIFNSSYLLDTEDWTWRDGPKAQPMGSGTASHVVQDCGSKRCGHQAVLNSDNGEILVFGGRIPGEALAGDMQKLLPSL